MYVDFEGISRRKFLTGLEPELINVMIGKYTEFIKSNVCFTTCNFLRLSTLTFVELFIASIQVPYRLIS